MGTVFALAGDFAALPLDEIEALLEEDIHEARAGALRIMANRAKAKWPTKRRGGSSTSSICDATTASTTGISSTSARGTSSAAGCAITPAQCSTVWPSRSRSGSGERRCSRRLPSCAAANSTTPTRSPSGCSAIREDMVRKPIGAVLRSAGDTDEHDCSHFSTARPRRWPVSRLRFAIEHLDEPTRRHYLALTAETN